MNNTGIDVADRASAICVVDERGEQLGHCERRTQEARPQGETSELIPPPGCETASAPVTSTAKTQRRRFGAPRALQEVERYR